MAAKNAGIDTSPLLDYVVESLDGVNFIPRDKAEQMYRIISAKSVVTVPKATFTYKTEMDAIRAQMAHYI